MLHGKKAADSAYIDRVTESLVLKDIKTVVRISVLLRDQEWRGYREAMMRHAERQWKFEPALYEKSLADKEAALLVAEKTAARALEAKVKIERETLREGFRNIVRAKFFNEWVTAQQLLHAEKTKDPVAKLDVSLADQELDAFILKCFDEIGQDNDLPNSKGETNLESGEASQPAQDNKKFVHAVTTPELNFATSRNADEAEFMTRIEGAFAKVVEARKLQVSQRQLYHCLGVMEHLRRRKAVAIVGPVCSGKTQILKLVSQALQIAYDIIFRTAAINP